MTDGREFRMCVAKRRFESREAAVFFASARLQRAYRCPYCAGWHLTTTRVGMSR